MELKNITVKEFFEIKDKSPYIFAIKYSAEFKEPEDTFEIGDVYQLSFGFIKDFQKDMEEGTLNLLKQLDFILSIKPKLDISKMKLDKFCRGCSYLVNQIRELLETEVELLSNQPTVEEMQAGLDGFNGLGIYLQTRQLAGNDVTKIEQVRSLPYEVCFLELYTRKKESEFQKNLQEIYRNKK